MCVSTNMSQQLNTEEYSKWKFHVHGRTIFKLNMLSGVLYSKLHSLHTILISNICKSHRYLFCIIYLLYFYKYNEMQAEYLITDFHVAFTYIHFRCFIRHRARIRCSHSRRRITRELMPLFVMS